MSYSRHGKTIGRLFLGVLAAFATNYLPATNPECKSDLRTQSKLIALPSRNYRPLARSSPGIFHAFPP
jgi:hypothetical protein